MDPLLMRDETINMVVSFVRLLWCGQPDAFADARGRSEETLSKSKTTPPTHLRCTPLALGSLRNHLVLCT